MRKKEKFLCCVCNKYRGGPKYNYPYSQSAKTRFVQNVPKYCGKCVQPIRREMKKFKIRPGSKITMWEELRKKEKDKHDSRYRDKAGHITLVHRATKRWAKKVHQDDNFITVAELKRWSMDNGPYFLLYKTWAEQDFHDDYAPMLTRLKYPGNYKLGNLIWTSKKTVGIGITQKIYKAQTKAVIKEIRENAEKKQKATQDAKRKLTPQEREARRARTQAVIDKQFAMQKELSGGN